MQSDLCSEASLLMQQIMESYISGDPERIRQVLTWLSPDILVIGTGKHEYYHNLEALAQGLEKDQEEALGINFIINKQWYTAKLIHEDVCLVYGEFCACEADTKGKQMVIEMDTRITATVHREPDGRLIVDSIHQSVPYIYQQEGEYYPKTFADKAEEALRRSEMLEKDIQLDLMTGLFNRKYTELHITDYIKNEMDGVLFLLDLDNFKSVNDVYGHQMGDALIKKISAVLQSSTRETDIAGRVGGDEFMLFMPGVIDHSDAENIAKRLLAQMKDVFLSMNLEQGCSIGLLWVQGEDMTFEESYRRADAALYRAKAEGKGKFCWYED